MYGDLDNVCMFTLAPEIPNAASVIEELCRRNIKVSLGKLDLNRGHFAKFIFKKMKFLSLTQLTLHFPGHSVANLREGEQAVKHGASFITHLFNAMLPVSWKMYPFCNALVSDLSCTVLFDSSFTTEIRD